ncbi:cilia- and flagella-associated protein 58-like [Saccostrea echinata]|uniref:cilia- and flagella-associated protein 58-like n=1 Tax=Saccostrea echinata TaxID=191078 RepID=UPI002A7F20D1|nr:cilia- and flagella-associated protein 58-like [Saccostrea echinata]
MQALLDLPVPKNNLTSLRHFHDQVETYVRGLESFGQAQDTYGSLLVPIILNKLPSELRKNLAREREHGSTDWLLGDLRNSLYRELDILEAGTHMDTAEESATAIFYIHSKSSDEKVQQNYSHQKHQVCCALCKESHHSNDCERYRKQNDRVKILKRDKLCFNCLGRHRVADCQSKSNCKICKRRHHTSLCTAHDVVKNKKVNTPTLQAKAELDAKTREIKKLQGHLQNYKSDITKLEQQIKEQKIVNEKTMRDVKFLQTRLAKLQTKFDAQLIATNQLTVENQAQVTELKKKEVEVNKLKQEIQGLNISRETLQRKHQQPRDKNHSDVEQQRETFTDQITGLKRELEAAKKLAEVDKKNLKQNIQNYREETQEKMNIIYQLRRERDHYINEANNLTQNYMKDNKVHGMQILDYKKKISENDTKIRQQQNLYEAFKDEKNTYRKNIIESQDAEITDMKRKVNIMDQQIDQLKQEIQAKENAFIKEYFEHHNAYADKDKENFRSELNHLTANKAFST